jgi:hypothetical protein
VQPAHLQAALVAAVDLGLKRDEVDVEHLGRDQLEHEGPALAEHAHVDVLASGAVELVLARLEEGARHPADELLHAVARQLAEALALLAAAAAARVALAGRAEEERLRQVARELAIAPFEEDLGGRDAVLEGLAHGGAPLRGWGAGSSTIDSGPEG